MSRARVKIAIMAVTALALISANGFAAAGEASMQLTSSAFKEGQMIPADYTCDGRDASPPLAWSGAPDGAKSFALIADDPDAPGGTWVHWLIINIPPAAKDLKEGLPTNPKLADGAL